MQNVNANNKNDKQPNNQTTSQLCYSASFHSCNICTLCVINRSRKAKGVQGAQNLSPPSSSRNHRIHVALEQDQDPGIQWLPSNNEQENDQMIQQQSHWMSREV